MKPIRPIENIYGALWKSAVTETIARSGAAPASGAGASAAEAAAAPLHEAADRYIDSLQKGKPIKPPKKKGELLDSDPDIMPYLMQLHHQLAHAKINDDKVLQKQLNEQLGRFKFGNPLWQQMFTQYFEYYAQYPYHLGGQPHYRSWKDTGGSLDYSVVEWRIPATGRIAIIGDIGTGTDVAAAVLLSALSFKPDAILHLGDVYYSGTKFEFEHRFTGLFESVFRAQKHKVPVFTVPGNHEYFTGNVSFLDTLDSGVLAPHKNQRQSASYWCLRSADDGWQFLGMDTGYNGHAMAVSPQQQQAALAVIHKPLLGDKSEADLPVELPPADTTAMVTLRDDEVAWHHDKMDRFSGRSILLSHHQLYSAVQSIGKAQSGPADINRAWINTAIWQQLGAYFGTKVAAWIWGHEHNLGIFQDNYRPADWSADPNAYKTLPKGRCAGHAAIPVQDVEKPYATTYPVPLQQTNLQLSLINGWYNRGFAILELAGTGQPLRARYFQVANADPTPLLIYDEQIA